MSANRLTRVSLPAGTSVPPGSSRQPSNWSGAKGPAPTEGAAKLVHFVRHAQGHHNVSQAPIYQRPHDAYLTQQGVEQCAALQAATCELRPELVVASPLTRTVQTATLCFDPQRAASGAPLLALEAVRETVNFLCDGRRPISTIRAEFDHVDFAHCTADEDAVWAKYEARHGSATAYTGHRESADLPAVAARWQSAASWLAARPEREIVLVSHCAFLQAIFGTINGRDGKPPPLFDFGGDRDLEAWLAMPFCNCEMRSVLLTFGGGA